MTRLRREVGEQLIAAYSHVEMPPRLVENEARAMVQQTVEQARAVARTCSSGRCPPGLHGSCPQAGAGRPAGRRGRAPQRAAPGPKRLNETLRLIASTYEEPEQVIELYRNDPQLMSGLQNRVMEEQVIDWIAERAQHTEQALSFQEAIRQ